MLAAEEAQKSEELEDEEAAAEEAEQEDEKEGEEGSGALLLTCCAALYHSHSNLEYHLSPDHISDVSTGDQILHFSGEVLMNLCLNFAKHGFDMSHTNLGSRVKNPLNLASVQLYYPSIQDLHSR